MRAGIGAHLATVTLHTSQTSGWLVCTTVRVMRAARTGDGQAQVAQRGGGERNDGVQPVDLLAQVHRQRLRGPARQLLQPLAHRFLVKQRRHLRTSGSQQLRQSMRSCMRFTWLNRPRLLPRCSLASP